jgi:hypothetical protein
MPYSRISPKVILVGLCMPYDRADRAVGKRLFPLIVGAGVRGRTRYLTNGYFFSEARVRVVAEPGFLCLQILADPVGQTDGATRIDFCYEGTGGANHQQN